MYLSMLEVECNVCCGAVGGTHGACGQGESVADHVGNVQRTDRVGVSNGRSNTHQGTSQLGVISARCTAPAVLAARIAAGHVARRQTVRPRISEQWIHRPETSVHCRIVRNSTSKRPTMGW